MLEPDCEGRVALATGSASGIGRAFVLALADASAGLTDPAAVDACFGGIEAELGSVDVLANNVDEDSGYVSGSPVEVDGGWLPEDV